MTSFQPRKLKKCRLDMKLSQENLVSELYKFGLRKSRQTWISWEKGLTDPDVNDLSMIASFFKKSPEYFFS